MRWRQLWHSSVLNEHGASLIEVLTVVVVMAIAAAIAAPDVRALQWRLQTSLFAKELASELRQARQLAITQRQRVGLVFDAGQHTVSAQIGPGRVIHHVFPYQDWRIEVEEPTAGPEIMFYPSGRTSTATTIRFHHAHGESGTMTVSLTGLVSIR